MLQAPGVPGKRLPVIVPAAQDLLGDSTGKALQRSASVRLLLPSSAAAGLLTL
jgi:hypothetical protein